MLSHVLAPSKFNLVGVDLFSFEDPDERYNVCGHPDSVIKGLEAFTFAVNLIVPSSDNLSVVLYFQPPHPEVLTDGSAFSELFVDFLDGDDAFRNSRFKLIPMVVEGGFIIKQSVGAKPALIAKKLKCPYTRADNYFEVDVDISSDSVASVIVGLVKGATKSLVVDIAFMLESQSEDELPESILGAVRLQRLSLDNPVRVPSSK
jgi:hypothetical protein